MTLGDVDESLSVQNLLAPISFRRHLELELLLDISVVRFEILDLEACTIYTPFLYRVNTQAYCDVGKSLACMLVPITS